MKEMISNVGDNQTCIHTSKRRSGLPRLIRGVAVAALLASCAGADESDTSEQAPAREAVSGMSQDWALLPKRSREEWHGKMSRTAMPRTGCFTVAHPSTEWKEVPCAAQPKDPVPLSPAPRGQRASGPLTVGGSSGDFMAQVSGTITRAEGSFPSVVGLTSVSSNNVANAYTLQLNTNTFTGASQCSGRPGCVAWQQYAYQSQLSRVFIEYWLIGYGTGACPSGGWQHDAPSSSNCYLDSLPVGAPGFIPITDLPNMKLSGTATGGSVADSVFFTAGNGIIYAGSFGSIFSNLAQAWTSAEFNIFGSGNLSQAVFNPGTSMVVQTLTDSRTPTTTAPACTQLSTTGETNSLTLTAGSCCPVGGTTPGIQFTQSNNGTRAQACPFVTQAPVAFQANTNNLWIERNFVGADQFLGMKAGTVPSLVTLMSGGLAVAFQANSGNLWLQKNGVATDQRLGMMAGTSPALATTDNDILNVAFQANTGSLWYQRNGSAGDQRLGMKAGTSPAIAVAPNGEVWIAFQANTGSLWLWNHGNGTDQRLGMAAGTSPSIAMDTNSQPMVAFQANTGSLWLLQRGSASDQRFGMRAGTSPSVALLSNGDIAVAFQANTSELWVSRNGIGQPQGLGMATTASPTIVPIQNGGYQVAFEANSGSLWLDVNGVGSDQRLGMNTP